MKPASELALAGLNKTACIAKTILIALLFFVPQQSKGFALLGPYADWMQPTNGFRFPGEIGGAMDLDEEYRWNVPLLTYGFDQTFIDFFGSNGVAAVEQAFQILNELPPASSLNLSDYSENPRQKSPAAEVGQQFDLKSATLGVIVEQLGLAPPTRSIFVLRKYDPVFELFRDELTWPEGTIPNLVFERNFDPELLTPSNFVNNSRFTGEVYPWVSAGTNYAYIFFYVIDPLAPYRSAVADQELWHGDFFSGLSADDAGGLRYLLQPSNVNYETLLPDVRGTTNQVYVNAAMRPGVNKITFVRQQFDSLIQQWIPVTNEFTDIYLSDDQPMEQTLERIVTEPDFLFSVGDTGKGMSFTPLISRTGTTNWSKSDLETSGPGTIRPPVKFIFNKLNRIIFTHDALPEEYPELSNARWASFDDSTNPPVIYPAPGFVETNQFIVRLRLTEPFPRISQSLEWHVPISFQETAILQTSTNLTTWTTITTVTNLGGAVEWNHQRLQSQRFFRAVPE